MRFLGMFRLIKQGWVMAEINPDGSHATAAQRAYNFASNGGGAITYRVLVTLMSAVIVTLIGWMWSDIGHRFDSIDQTLRDHTKTMAQDAEAIAVHERRLNDADSARNIIWQSVHATTLRVDDHEHRITVLEAQAHWPYHR